MDVRIFCIGKLKTSAPEAALESAYKTKVRWPVQVTEKQIKKDLPPEVLKQEESQLLLTSCPEGAYKIVLDERGEMLSSTQFADLIQKVQEHYATLAFFIGGAYGHSPKMRESADKVWALSRLTFPHFMVRPVLMEQLYRAQTLLDGHPYHKV